MKRQSILVLVVAIIFYFGIPQQKATSTMYYNDGGAHQLSTALGENVSLNVSNATTLTILPGATARGVISYDDSNVFMTGGWMAMGASGYGNSYFNISGGTLSEIYGNDSHFHDYAQAVIDGGLIKRGIQTYGNSQLYVNGGEIRTGLLALQDSQIFIKGGTIAATNGQISSRGENADIFIYGTGFNYDYGEISDLSGILTGTLLNGDSISCWFYRQDESGDMNYGTITLVPVPPAVILGGLGLTFSGWLLKRRKML